MACYSYWNGTINDMSAVEGACSSKGASQGTVTCCYVGDQCLSDGICQYSHGGIPGGSGYYEAGCTDPNYNDPACRQQCNNQTETDIVYVEDEGTWKCCGMVGDQRLCSNPIGNTFNAPAPAQLATLATIAATNSAIMQVSTTASTSSLTSSTATATATRQASTSPPASASASPSGLSAGAQAAIGIAITLVGLAAIALGLLWLRQRRRSKRQILQLQEEMAQKSKPLPFVPSDSSKAEMNAAGNYAHTAELKAAPPYRPSELPQPAYHRSELPQPAPHRLDPHELGS